MAIVCAFSFVVKRVPVAAGTETCLTQKITVMKKGLSTMLAILFAACAVSFAQSKGYEKSIEVNAGVALDKMSKFSFGVSMINGYRINEHFFIGALVGYEYFDALYMSSYQPEEDSYKSYDPKNLLKIGARVKANLSKGKISPFLSFDIGGGIQVVRTDYYPATGIYLEPAFGVDFKLQEKQTVYVMLGYHAQNNRYGYFNLSSSNPDSSEKKVLAGLFDIRVGFRF